MNARRSRLLPAIGIGLAVLLVLLAIAVRVVPNRLLRSNSIRSQVNEGPDSGLLDYESAESRLPGTIHVKNLTFRDRDPKAEWSFALAEGT